VEEEIEEEADYHRGTETQRVRRSVRRGLLDY
jgi:hypothetical protein